ncbi:GIY-YIG nuclease family protein [Patescibacteria group bacterium]
MQSNSYFVYIMTNRQNGVLYIGITHDLYKRSFEHRYESPSSFVSKYKLYKLVYYEVHTEPYEAIRREKQMKLWKREWKINLINKFNPNWKDLVNDLM